MKHRSAALPVLALLALSLLLARCGGGGSSSGGSGSTVPLTTSHAVVAWNDLGMHCMDNDYSVFAILPPFNNLHAQVVNRQTGGLVSSGITVTYEATADTRGSIDSFATGKTNFWDHVLSLFGASPAPGTGLAGNAAPSATPAPMAYDNALRCFRAAGIPIVPVDDAGRANMYPMVKVVARNAQGAIVAETKTVLPVSTEMTCAGCHASGGGPDALPAGGWVNEAPGSDRDWKLNILRKHDELNFAINGATYSASLAWAGFDATGLENTVRLGRTPVLCAKCHASNALGTTGAAGVKPLTAAVHSHHGPVIEDATGLPLDNGSRTACYVCHPGSVTQCLRGVMGNAVDNAGNPVIQCQSCHGNVSAVGASTRAGWVDLPDCGMCHTLGGGGYARSDNVFSSPGVQRAASGVFGSPGLYKVSAGHGNIQCEGCHGATHAEYSCSEANDNVQSVMLQGYAGKIGECNVCHATVPLTKSSGPHGLHTIGAAWVSGHAAFARADPSYCATCHGADYRGTFLSAAFRPRTFSAGDFGARTFAKGHKVGCYDCHNGPTGR